MIVKMEARGHFGASLPFWFTTFTLFLAFEDALTFLSAEWYIFKYDFSQNFSLLKEKVVHCI